MRAGHPQICLYKPEIPQNAGTIGRLAAATQCRLHLIKPFGFSMDDRNLKRAGLDYWPFLDLEVHESIDEILQRMAPRVAFLSKRGKKSYTDIPADTDLIVFGQETSGLPETLWQKYPELFYSLPLLHPGVRSINLANAVSVVVYDQLRQRSLQ